MEEMLDCDGNSARPASSIGIQVQRAAGRTPDRVVGSLVNLSLRGAKLSLESPIQTQEAVTLKLQNTDLNSELTTGGKIKRLLPGGDGSWTVGCLFTEPLPRLVLRNLFCGDRAELRKTTRYPIEGRAIIDWESGRQNEVQLEDISAGGFRMLATEAAPIGARLQLVVRTAGRKRFVVPAVVRWQLESPEGHAIGCQFMYDEGSHLIKAILAEKGSDRSGKGLWNLSRILQSLPKPSATDRPG